MSDIETLIRNSAQVEKVWLSIINEVFPLNVTVVSARSFFSEILDPNQNKLGSLAELVKKHNVWHENSLVTHFEGNSNGDALRENNYSPVGVIALGKQLTDRFHMSIPRIIKNNPMFIDKLRCIHFSNMRGNEDLILYPSQTKRLQEENVSSIAGEIRTIQTGFGEFRFNAPSVDHLEFLLSTYTKKVESLISEVNRDTIYEFVSFAQYYFTALHPFYERCGRTSEELIYVLFEQTDKSQTLYISKTGWRESPLATERMDLINKMIEGFNRKIAAYLGIDTDGADEIVKTPDIYKGLTKKYFSDKFEGIYCVKQDKQDRPFYYTHPIPEVLQMYYFAMESLLFDEMNFFDLKSPLEHITALGTHLKTKGHTEYTYQPENRETEDRETELVTAETG
ncbi:MAG: Fic family protein [Nanoarchaeota archaeon]|nr:Fic family protein [Nanoarchaeota archaeon]